MRNLFWSALKGFVMLQIAALVVYGIRPYTAMELANRELKRINAKYRRGETLTSEEEARWDRL